MYTMSGWGLEKRYWRMFDLIERTRIVRLNSDQAGLQTAGSLEALY